MNRSIWIMLTMIFTLCVSAESQKTTETSDITVIINKIKGSEGKISIGLYCSEQSWPETGKEFKGVYLNVSSSTLTYTFKEIPHGVYAIAVSHDENSNNKLDTGMFGIPKEGYAFSNNIFGSFGPPAFEDALFALNENRDIHISMKY